MNRTKTWQMGTVALFVLFLYLVATEVIPRWVNVGAQYAALKEKKESILTPEELAEKQMALLSRKKSLRETLTEGGKQYEQSETGVFEYINASAKETGIRFQSITPVASRSLGQINEIGFRLRFEADYNRIGFFINTLESGIMLSQIRSLEMLARDVGSPVLQVNTEGSVYVLSSSANGSPESSQQ